MGANITDCARLAIPIVPSCPKERGGPALRCLNSKSETVARPPSAFPYRLVAFTVSQRKGARAMRITTETTPTTRFESSSPYCRASFLNFVPTRVSLKNLDEHGNTVFVETDQRGQRCPLFRCFSPLFGIRLQLC